MLLVSLSQLFDSICAAVNCSPLAEPDHGSVALSKATSYKSVAKYTCNTGYKLQGPTERRCEKDEQWSGNNPTCESESLTNCCCNTANLVHFILVLFDCTVMFDCTCLHATVLACSM